MFISQVISWTTGFISSVKFNSAIQLWNMFYFQHIPPILPVPCQLLHMLPLLCFRLTHDLGLDQSKLSYVSTHSRVMSQNGVTLSQAESRTWYTNAWCVETCSMSSIVYIPMPQEWEYWVATCHRSPEGFLQVLCARYSSSYLFSFGDIFWYLYILPADDIGVIFYVKIIDWANDIGLSHFQHTSTTPKSSPGSIPSTRAHPTKTGWWVVGVPSWILLTC